MCSQSNNRNDDSWAFVTAILSVSHLRSNYESNLCVHAFHIPPRCRNLFYLIINCLLLPAVQKQQCYQSLFSLLRSWQLGMHLCVAGWLEGGRVGYPTRFPSVRCGDNVVGIVTYKDPVDQSSKYDAYCYRVRGTVEKDSRWNSNLFLYTVYTWLSSSDTSACVHYYLQMFHARVPLVTLETETSVMASWPTSSPHTVTSPPFTRSVWKLHCQDV